MTGKGYKIINSFHNARTNHGKENAEDYVEIVADLIQENGEARIVDISKRLGIAQATANKTIKRLIKDGYLFKEPYRSVFLTIKGQKLARDSKKRHKTVYELLRSLGVSKKTAIHDSEGIEHHVSKETLEAFKKIIKKHNKIK
ncbi:MAG: Transcriptional regulator MntR [Alphaproteobacteria bacterium MarineAlpha5_Bin11]|nr:transcriptional regulator MntR [Pelagibacteraceae bacterium]PPR44373.1 MAG: Transcriptional regulator MntR [Alphaproteobacteria bacterium MarineAlpha5_Bin11]PPR51492.1 MAG: Transcriptional regulator MntR [Alphaproteobacteria bacterium MarineAlpha5_Bin10]|tara:strand:- start:945 stop:1373 length:429 start_codon:yes stop_codon:yes gene_type:complete